MSTNDDSLKEQKFDSLLDDALAARNRGDYRTAIEICGAALAVLEEGDSFLLTIVHGEMGYIHWKLNDPATAQYHYSISVSNTPTSELASLGLYHSLVAQGMWVGGLEEVVRFLENKYSAEYDGLLSHEFVESLPGNARSLALKARNLIKRYGRTGRNGG